MQTNLTEKILSTESGQRADQILRKCVHCGFCTATCPTYQLLNDELDGPRGRIYLVKNMLEGGPVDRETQLHLDRCLTCRSCETTCPSGVNYAELIDIGRLHAERQNLRPWHEKMLRWLLGEILPWHNRNRWIFKLGSQLRFILPAVLKQKTPNIRAISFQAKNTIGDKGKVLLLQGCVQSTISPNTNAAAEQMLVHLGYEVLIEKENHCCGALNHHLNQTQAAENWMKSNLDNWQKYDNSYGIDAIVSTASGCGIMLKDYEKLLPLQNRSDQTSQLLNKICDISELLDIKVLQDQNFVTSKQNIAFHAPCTLQHGHKLGEHLFNQLSQLGYNIHQPEDAHLCCGSAGTYSLLQPEISRQLQQNKMKALNQLEPDVIITANVGCEHHLQAVSDNAVVHWVELISSDLKKNQ